MKARAATVALAAALAGCGSVPEPDRPEPYVTETGDVITICAPIVEKDDSYPGRWAFGFDPYNGGWVSVPVSRAAFDRLQVGDWVRVEHRVGELADVSTQGCDR